MGKWRVSQEQLINHVKKLDYPKLDENKIDLVKHHDWWDGAMSGLARYEGNLCWFDWWGDCPKCDGSLGGCDCPDTGQHYFYVLFPLTESEATEADFWLGKCKDKDWNYLGPDLSQRIPLGWFVDGANQSFYPIQVAPATESK